VPAPKVSALGVLADTRASCTDLNEAEFQLRKTKPPHIVEPLRAALRAQLAQHEDGTPPYVAGCLTVFSDVAVERAAHALMALRDQTDDFRAAEPELLDAAVHPDEFVRLLARALLVHLHSAAVVPLLMVDLEAERPDRRRRAATLLVEGGTVPAEARSRLEHLALYGDWDERVEMTLALTHLASALSLPVFLRLLTAQRETLQTAAIEGLERLGHNALSAAPVLEATAQTHWSARVRTRAASALFAIAGKRIETLSQACTWPVSKQNDVWSLATARGPVSLRPFDRAPPTCGRAALEAELGRLQGLRFPATRAMGAECVAAFDYGEFGGGLVALPTGSGPARVLAVGNYGHFVTAHGQLLAVHAGGHMGMTTGRLARLTTQDGTVRAEVFAELPGEPILQGLDRTGDLVMIVEQAGEPDPAHCPRNNIAGLTAPGMESSFLALRLTRQSALVDAR
jgi:HEAT repeat protein